MEGRGRDVFRAPSVRLGPPRGGWPLRPELLPAAFLLDRLAGGRPEADFPEADFPVADRAEAGFAVDDLPEEDCCEVDWREEDWREAG